MNFSLSSLNGNYCLSDAASNSDSIQTAHRPIGNGPVAADFLCASNVGSPENQGKVSQYKGKR